MCRLLGYAAPHATTVAAALGADQLHRFGQLSCVHGDGWGTSWLAGDALERYRSPAAAVADPASFDHHTGLDRSGSTAGDGAAGAGATGAEASARIVHLRWASAGHPVDPRNSHPFVGDGLAFAHNGWIHPEDRFGELLPAEVLDGLDGTTDSERYFAVIRRELAARPGDTAGAVRRAARAVRAVFPACSLNALVLSPTELVAVHANEGARGPVDTVRAMGDAAPLDHAEAYYQMRWRRADDGTVVVASSGMEADGWTPIPPESVLRVDLASLDLTVASLDADD